MKIVKKIIAYVLLAVGACFCVFVLANVPTAPVLDLFRGKVTQEELDEGYYQDYIGARGAEDILRLTAEKVEELDFMTPFVVETEDIIPMNYYRLKDSDMASTPKRNSSGRIIGTTQRPVTTEKTWFFDDFLYAGYYLVQLDDGSYITAYMNQDYANANTLPIGVLESTDSQWEEFIIDFVQDDTELDEDEVNAQYMLRLQPEESSVFGDIADLVLRLVIGGAVAIVLLCIFARIDTKFKLL